ncbi:winged helix-turn-helix transcriptional regulator [Candidatus Pyrohabitans sp.]
MQRESNGCIENKEDEICLCPIEGIINIISKKWALLIISALGNNEKLRFNEIMENLESISPKTLSDRLKELENAGLIKREVFAEIPPRVEYSLTCDGIELRNAMLPLMEWVSKREKALD